MYSLRRIAEEVLGPVVVRRRLPREFDGAPFYASGAAAGLKFIFKRSGSLDPDLLRNTDELVRRGDTVWDIGANVGMFAVAACVRVGPAGSVYGFEPDASLVRLLNRTIAELPLLNRPVIVPEAVAESTSVRQFSIAKRARASNALSGYGNSEMGGIRETREVQASSLDELLKRFPPPNVIKIDVEGAELEVLRGGRQKMLTQVRPLLLCEVSDRTRHDVSQILRSANYQMFNGLVPKAEWKRLEVASWDTVGIPAERVTG